MADHWLSVVIGVAAGALLVWHLFIADTRESDRTADDRVIVTYWEKWTEYEHDAIKAVVDRFNASQDRIEVRLLTVSTIDTKLLLAVTGGNPPDLAGLWTHSISTYSEKNALTPLNDALEAAGITRDDYIPVYWDMCTHRGFTWALPTTPTAMLLHWNKTLFAEAGLDPSRPPRTIEELDAMSEQLTIVEIERDGEVQRVRYPELTDTEKQSKSFRMVQSGHLPNVPGWWKQCWPYWFGGELVGEDDQIFPENEANLASLEWFESFPAKYGLENVRQFQSSFGPLSSPQDAFISGKVAMVFQGVWMNNFIKKFSGGMSFGAAPFPASESSGMPFVVLAEADVIVIPRGARHPEEAFEFLRFLQRPENMELLCLIQQKFSPLAHTSESFIREHPNPYISAFIEAANSPYTKYEPMIGTWHEYKAEVRALFDRVNSMVVDPEVGMRQLRERMQPKLERANRRWDAVEQHRLEQWSNDDSFTAS